MVAFNLITKNDLEKFKIDLFTELKKPGYKLNKKEEQKEWLKSYEVRQMLNILRVHWRPLGEILHCHFQRWVD